MKINLKFFTFKILILTLFLGLTSGFKTSDQLSKEQAIKLAEKFIVDNGYTSLPGDKSKLSYELFDSENNVDNILKGRHNSLNPKAFCISEDTDRWNVGFLSSSVDKTKLNSSQRKSNLKGRAVIVMKSGNEIRIAHKEPLFSYFEKL
ncbi:hypothetical protein SAMN04488062_11517 [Flavobacterium omnivorum]|uniref:Uncharacterized protein n=1 Tax=Flavobacterium omnivorum TaxID=178355 RepID=A0A1G8FF40_9FLAO|nr:hypothetical protein [Flavobacterium omnivorum]SDH80720.1 hypothetical protein SAMN04488062_11517 [Flavobacterium omnivorum]